MSDQLPQVELDVPVGDEFRGFAVFVVGGAVRDALRGVESSDVDLMAVPRPGEVSDPVDVLAERMHMVDPESTIPVFADSHNREVALPRAEEDAGAGHRDFDMHVVPADTPVKKAVKADLEKRDLTVNAMAVDARSGELFDPFDGAADLEAGVVRHVSEAFKDDPLRVVRLARFAPRLNADVAPETVDMARSVSRNRLRSLPVERVTNELRKVVKQADNAGRFVRVLSAVDALEVTFPVLSEQTNAVAETITAARNAADEDRFGAVMAALGDLLGPDADRFADAADLSNQEEATLNIGRSVLDSVARFDDLSDREAVDVFGRVNSQRGAGPDAFVAAAAARRGSVDREAVEDRLDRVADVFEGVDGAAVIDEESIMPGEDMDGEAFGELLADRRADAL